MSLLTEAAKGWPAAYPRYIDFASAEHYYACACGRWFGSDYRDPVTGETLQAHEHGGKQLDLFAESA